GNGRVDSGPSGRKLETRRYRIFRSQVGQTFLSVMDFQFKLDRQNACPTTMEDFAAIERRATRIKLLLMDCDGVLTDGRLMLLKNGDEQKTFNVRDGHGIVLLHRAGLKTGIISGRTSTATVRRARDLGISLVIQNSLDKIKDFEEVLASEQISESEVAFVGDDITDIPL